MVFNIPTNQQQVVDRTATDVQTALPTSNPFFKNSFLGSIIFSFAGRIYDFYLQLQILIIQLFVDTATGTFLERWGIYKGITRNPATQSSGLITITGVVASAIPISTQFADSVGNLFLTTASANIANVSLSISSLTRSGNLVTAIMASSHNFSSTQSVTISGAAQSEYNGIQTITVIDSLTFTYLISTTPITPATGTILASANMASVNVQSVAFGESQNLASGTRLTIGSPLAGINDNAIVQFTQIAGGTDLESDDDLRIRIIDIYQNPIAHFNVNDIVAKAKQVSGVTRVFVYESGVNYGTPLSVSSIVRTGQSALVTTSSPHGLEDCMNITISGANQSDYNVLGRILITDNTTFIYVVKNNPTTPATGTILAQPSVPLGQVIVFFTRDNDDDIIPSAGEVADVKAILNTIRPANTADSDLIVLSPIAVPVNFTFTALSPNTSTMQASINANLSAFFRESTSVGTTLSSFAYNSIIYQTIDTETGDVVQGFTLSSPSGDVSINAGQIPTLGSVTYP